MANKSTGNGTAKVAAGVLAIIAALGIVVLGMKVGYGTGATGSTAAPGAAQVQVLSAAADLKSAHLLVATDVKLVSYNQGTEPKHSIDNTKVAVGKYLLSDAAGGVPLTTDNLGTHADGVSVQAEHDGATPTSDFAVTPGNVALAIPTAGVGGGATSAINNIGNYAKPGNRIDVIGDPGTGSTHYLFQDILVLKVGSAGTTGSANTALQAASGGADVLVVLMSRQQAEEMTFLLNSKSTASLKYVLRGDDATHGELPSVASAGVPATDPVVNASTFAH